MTAGPRAARRAVTAAALVGGALATAPLTACGSHGALSASAASGQARPPGPSGTRSSASAVPSSPSSPSGTTAAQPAPMIPATQCPASALRVTATRTRGGAAAGTSYVPLDFTNISGHGCDMYGFPGVSFVTGHPGRQIGAAAARQATFGPETVRLAGGATAHAWLGIADPGDFAPPACHQVTAHWLKIYPPDQFSALYVRLTAAVCAKKVSGSIPLMILPVRPGAGSPGSVP